jgi:hypothetical protein
MHWGIVIPSRSVIQFAPQITYRHLVNSGWSLHNNSLLFSDRLVLSPIGVRRMVMGTSVHAITVTRIHSPIKHKSSDLSFPLG